MDALLEQARTGDEVALQELLLTLMPSAQKFGLQLCKHAQDAEDVAQDTLINVIHHLDEFEGRSSLLSWVFALARSACARKRRGLKNRPHESDDRLEGSPDDTSDPEMLTAQREMVAMLSQALAALSKEHREIIILRDVEGLSAPQVAEQLGLGVDAVKSRLHRAREALKDVLVPKFNKPEFSALP